MGSETVIEVKDLVKYFKIYYDKGSQLKERILFRKRSRYEERRVLDGISFSVQKGEAIGLIGSNGCGKSTTLKLLSRIIYPDSGSVTLNGRVSSLIELGAGFHPDMRGRENIYINASIFGLTKKEIDERIDDIIEFSELEEFMDNPVRTYSSGMYMRLAFSVAINVNADILLIDEILAVGDANFQAKCFEKLREIKASGVTIVIVTHDSGTIERFCDRAFWIDEGKIKAGGNSREVVDQYLRHMNEKKIEKMEEQEKKRQEKEEKQAQQSANFEKREGEEQKKKTEAELLHEQAMDYNVKHFGVGSAVIKRVTMKNSLGEETRLLKENESFSLEYEYEVRKKSEELVFGMGIYTLDGVWIFGTNTQLGNVRIPCPEKEGQISFQGEGMNLLTGKYILQVSITDVDGTPVDFYRDYLRFHVVSEKRDSGIVYFDNHWVNGD